MHQNLCIRCGKIRIESKRWTEVIKGSSFTYTQNICPDGACQEVVNLQMQEKQEKTAAFQQKSAERKKILSESRKRA